MEGTSIAESDVMEYLQKHYQEADLGWVSGCHWVSDNVLLEDIDWEDRPGGIDEDKVSDKVEKLEKSQPHPVVLVAPDPESKMRVADGLPPLRGPQPIRPELSVRLDRRSQA